ncbi:hypothetical protein, partial [uncultured Chryseobacterium sp.]|uniref:hypothetical protein n=1 Tax=uncultured Chryseobacterium sp. TaxID=259322 RepID=UPI0025FF7A6E
TGHSGVVLSVVLPGAGSADSSYGPGLMFHFYLGVRAVLDCRCHFSEKIPGCWFCHAGHFYHLWMGMYHCH